MDLLPAGSMWKPWIPGCRTGPSPLSAECLAVCAGAMCVRASPPACLSPSSLFSLAMAWLMCPAHGMQSFPRVSSLPTTGRSLGLIVHLSVMFGVMHLR